MDFFASQDRARKSTKWLVFYFFLALVAIIAAVYFCAMGAMAYTTKKWIWWDLRIFALSSLATSLVISLGSLYKYFELLGGGERIAESLGGRRICNSTQDPDERRLLNVVEEMAIAAGTPVPPVYILPNEDSINAFAAGYSPGDAVIGVNRGTIRNLNRKELQGVIAHEFSHILNGDMRLNLRLISWLHGILLLSIVGEIIFRIGFSSDRSSSSSKDDNKGGLAALGLIGVAVWLVGLIGLFFGRLIKAAVSRQREYLADASAVQFTRDPSGISGALKKIGGLTHGSRLNDPHVEEVSHLFFAKAIKLDMTGLLSTHPPLLDRIKRIEPSFNAPLRPVTTQWNNGDEAGDAVSQFSASPAADVNSVLAGKFQRVPVKPNAVFASIGNVDEEHLHYAEGLLRKLPPILEEGAREPFSARAVVIALLLGTTREHLQLQYPLIQPLGEPVVKAVARYQKVLVDLPSRLRLPLIEILQSTLSTLTPTQYREFRATIQALVEADGKLGPLEFVLQSTLITHLDRKLLNKQPMQVRYKAMQGVAPEVITLISALAYAGRLDGDSATLAFRTGMKPLGASFESAALLPATECTLRHWALALRKLSEASEVIRSKVLMASIVTISVDGEATVEEAELLRAIAEQFDCPVPPILAGKVTPVAV